MPAVLGKLWPGAAQVSRENGGFSVNGKYETGQSLIRGVASH